MRYARFLAFGLVLALGTYPAWAQPGTKKSAPGTNVPVDDVDAPLRLPFAFMQMPYYAKIDSVGKDGKLQISPQSLGPNVMPMGPPPQLIEGYYVGILQSDMALLNGAKLVRVQVTDVKEDNMAEVQIAKSAAAAIEPDEFLLLFRPSGVTTARMKSVPDLAPLIEGEAPGKKKDDVDTVKLNQSFNNCKQIGLALHNFHDVYRHFPPAVIVGPDNKPWHSWRVLILPFIDQAPLYNMYRFDEPWDGPNNKKLLDKIPPVYSDPIHGQNKELFTHYVAITGDDMAFTAEGADFDGKNIGPAMSGGRGIAQFTDGTSNTLLIGPVGSDRKIPWMKPEDQVIDATFPDLGKKGGFAAPYKLEKGNAAPFLFADGAVRGLLDTIDHHTFHKLLSLDDGEPIIGGYPSVDPLPAAGGLMPVIYIIKEGDKTTARMAREPMEMPLMMPGMPGVLNIGPGWPRPMPPAIPGGIPAPGDPPPLPAPPRAIQKFQEKAKKLER